MFIPFLMITHCCDEQQLAYASHLFFLTRSHDNIKVRVPLSELTQFAAPPCGYMDILHVTEFQNRHWETPTNSFSSCI